MKSQIKNLLFINSSVIFLNAAITKRLLRYTRNDVIAVVIANPMKEDEAIYKNYRTVNLLKLYFFNFVKKMY